MKNAAWAMTHPGYGLMGYQCEVCKKIFAHHKDYDNHIEIVHPDKAEDLMCAKEYHKAFPKFVECPICLLAKKNNDIRIRVYRGTETGLKIHLAFASTWDWHNTRIICICRNCRREYNKFNGRYKKTPR